MSLDPKRYAKSDKNVERAQAAKAAYIAYADSYKFTEEGLSDLLCDLQHLARQNRIDFDKVLRNSKTHYAVESKDPTGFR